MEIPVSDAKAQLTELVRRAEAGEDIVLTRHGHAVARLVPMGTKPAVDMKQRMAFLQDLARRSAEIALPGKEASEADHFLYS